MGYSKSSVRIWRSRMRSTGRGRIPLYVLLVVHPDGVSTWATNDAEEAFRPCFGPRSWPDALALLPVDLITTARIRTEDQATAWPR
jgi:hypothetical protein